MKRCESYRSLGMDQLEVRRLLAGDCTVDFDGERLDIRCDNRSNQIEVFEHDDGNLIVKGISGTEVNGQTGAVSLGSAADLEDVEIKTSRGDDEVTLRDLVVAESLEIKTGSGKDVVTGRHLNIGEDLEIKTEQGADRVDLFHSGDGSNKVGKNVVIKTGSGADVVEVSDLFAGHDIKIDTGNDPDSVSAKYLFAGETVKIKTGKSDDRSTIANIEAGNDIVLDGGGGRGDVLRVLGELVAHGEVKKKNFEVLDPVGGPSSDSSPPDHGPPFGPPPRDHGPPFGPPPRNHGPPFGPPSRDHGPPFGPPQANVQSFDGLFCGIDELIDEVAQNLSDDFPSLHGILIGFRKSFDSDCSDT